MHRRCSRISAEKLTVTESGRPTEEPMCWPRAARVCPLRRPCPPCRAPEHPRHLTSHAPMHPMHPMLPVSSLFFKAHTDGTARALHRVPYPPTLGGVRDYQRWQQSMQTVLKVNTLDPIERRVTVGQATIILMAITINYYERPEEGPQLIALPDLRMWRLRLEDREGRYRWRASLGPPGGTELPAPPLLPMPMPMPYSWRSRRM